MIRILSPPNGSVISQLTKEQRSFIEDSAKRNAVKAESFDYLNLVADGMDKTQPSPVFFEWESDKEYDKYILSICTSNDFTSGITISAEQASAEVYNLLLGKQYFFKVQAGNESSEVFTFFTELKPPRSIHVPGLVNVRDFGGWMTSSGKWIRQGLLYRGCKMEATKSGNPPIITDDGKKVLCEQLKIKTDIDLRADSIEKYTDTVLSDYKVEYKILPCKAYEEFFLDECKQGNKAIIETLADEKIYPVYLHCWGGADRTGMIVFVLGAILGMSEEDMLLDFEYTSLAIWGVRSRNGNYIQDFKNALAVYGSSEGDWRENMMNYLRSIEITEETFENIRGIFLEEQ